MPFLFAFPEMDKLSQSIVSLTDLQLGEFEMRSFPDGDSYVRIISNIDQDEAVILCSLNNPDQKSLRLMFLAETLKELGAKRVGLVAPYLGYMRQDTRFKKGEAITSKFFGQFLSDHVDWMITVDPHLHRYKTLGEIYTMSTHVIHAAEDIAHWVSAHLTKPLLIGPDMESEQWVSEVANKADIPFLILEKIRHGDRKVEVSLPEVENYHDHTPVLIDDIISTAHTMIETVNHLKILKMKSPICIGVHGIFADKAYETLKQSGTEQIITCNTIQHPSNKIDLSGSLAGAILRLVEAG